MNLDPVPVATEGSGRDDDLFSRASRDRSARDHLAALYAPLASSLARRFAGRGEPVEDLTQVAMIGLINAIDRFEPSREVRFSTYATATIVGELKRHFRDKGWALRVPRRLQEMSLRVNTAIGELWQKLGRSPTVREVADRTGCSEEEVIEAREALQAYSTMPLDSTGGEETLALAERLGAIDENLELSEGWASVGPLLAGLPGRERMVLFLRFYRDMTQTEIAAELGISQMHVSRLLAQTLAKLREGLHEEHLDEEQEREGT